MLECWVVRRERTTCSWTDRCRVGSCSQLSRQGCTTVASSLRFPSSRTTGQPHSHAIPLFFSSHQILHRDSYGCRVAGNRSGVVAIAEVREFLLAGLGSRRGEGLQHGPNAIEIRQVLRGPMGPWWLSTKLLIVVHPRETEAGLERIVLLEHGHVTRNIVTTRRHVDLAIPSANRQLVYSLVTCSNLARRSFGVVVPVVPR